AGCRRGRSWDSPGVARRRSASPYSLLQEGLRGLHDRGRFGVGADGDPEILARLRLVEPADEDLLRAQLRQPGLRAELRRPDEQEVGLAGEDVEPERHQLQGEPTAGLDDPAEVAAVIREIVQRRERRDLAEPVDVVAVADLVERG